MFFRQRTFSIQHSTFSIPHLLFRLVLGGAVAAWLFGDTVRRHWPAAFADTPDELSTIRFAHFGDYQDYELWHDIIEDFETRHRGVRVRQEYVPGMFGRYNIRMRRQITTGTLPEVALIQLGPFYELAPAFADLGGLLEEAPAVSSAGLPIPDDRTTESATSANPQSAIHNPQCNLDSVALSAFRIDGKQRALPVSGGTLQIYYNPACFERAGKFRGTAVPLPADDWTIDEFHETAKLLTCDFNGDGRIDQFGFWHPRWIYFLPFIWSMGAEVIDPQTGLWSLRGGRAEAAMKFYRDLLRGDRVCPREDEVAQLFQDVGFLTGKVGLCINGPWFQPFLDKTKLAGTYAVVEIPRGPGGRWTRVTWDGIVISSRTGGRRLEHARAFVRFVLSQSVQDRIAAIGRALPARTASLPVFTDTHDAIRRRPFVASLSYSRTQPRTPHFGELDRTINVHLREFLQPETDSTPSDLLDRLANDPVIREHFSAGILDGRGKRE